MSAIPPRPRETDLPIRMAAARKILPLIYEWMDEAREEHDDGADSLAGLMLTGGDGYQLARGLEDEWGIQPNAELVDTLDMAGSHILQAHRAAVVAWVNAHKIKTDLRLDQRARVKSGPDAGAVGTVVRVMQETGTLLLCCEGLGHVTDGPGVHGIVVPYENVEAAPAPALEGAA